MNGFHTAILSILLQLSSCAVFAIGPPTACNTSSLMQLTTRRINAPFGLERQTGSALMQNQFTRGEYEKQTRNNILQKVYRQNPSNSSDASDEPQSAPAWWLIMLVFFSATAGILFILVFLLYCAELMKRLVDHIQQKMIAGDEAKSSKQGDTSSAMRDSTPEIDEGELMSMLNGDAKRLQLLLDIAQSQNTKSMVANITGKCSGANKLKLSDASIREVAGGITALAKAANDLHKRKPPGETAKQKLQRNFRAVRSMVQVRRALKLPLHDHDECEWTGGADTGTVLADRYCDGHRGHLHSNHKDVRLSKSALGAYFASDLWLDHAAIAFIFFYSQLCGLVYAIYLKFRFPLMYTFMGPWVLVSRGEAMSVIVLTVLMTLMMSRPLITCARRHTSWSSLLQTIVDKHTLMHRACGGMLVVCSLLHILGHFRGSIPAIIHSKSNAEIDKAFTYGTKIKFNFNTWREAMLCYPAVTGFCLVAILLSFWTLSNEYVRRKAFELFFYPHFFLITAWYGMLIMHGARQWLGVGVPLALITVVPAALLYAILRVISISNAHSSAIHIVDAKIKKRLVLLDIDTGGKLEYNSGMYVMIKVPEISQYQWHPFTIAGGDCKNRLQVLFADVGDWTQKLRDLVIHAIQNSKPYPRICVQGGFGAPAQSMPDHEHVVMVGAGVGATPFLSFLANICTSAQAGVKSQFDSIKTAVFYWVSREPEDFLWVNEYSSIISATPSLRDRVSICLCMTKTLETAATDKCHSEELAVFWLGVQLAIKKFGARSLPAELGAPTQFGRPDWQTELSNHAQTLMVKQSQAPDKRDGLEIAVYVCGNPALVGSLEQACTSLTNSNVALRLYAEQF